MTTQTQTIIDLSDIARVVFECTKCKARISTPFSTGGRRRRITVQLVGPTGMGHGTLTKRYWWRWKGSLRRTLMSMPLSSSDLSWMISRLEGGGPYEH